MSNLKVNSLTKELEFKRKHNQLVDKVGELPNILEVEYITELTLEQFNQLKSVQILKTGSTYLYKCFEDEDVDYFFISLQDDNYITWYKLYLDGEEVIVQSITNFDISDIMGKSEGAKIWYLNNTIENGTEIENFNAEGMKIGDIYVDTTMPFIGFITSFELEDNKVVAITISGVQDDIPIPYAYIYTSPTWYMIDFLTGTKLYRHMIEFEYSGGTYQGASPIYVISTKESSVSLLNNFYFTTGQDTCGIIDDDGILFSKMYYDAANQVLYLHHCTGTQYTATGLNNFVDTVTPL